MAAPGNVLFRNDQRTFAFIDGPNNYSAAKSLGFVIDYKKLRDTLRKQTCLQGLYYFTPVIESKEYSSIRPMLDWLDYNGYTLVTKPVKEFTGDDGNRRTKGNLEVELTIEALNLAMSGKMDQMVLFSGNGDYLPLVMALQRRGVIVTVVSTKETSPPFVADELRRVADQFLELNTMGIEK